LKQNHERTASLGDTEEHRERFIAVIIEESALRYARATFVIRGVNKYSLVWFGVVWF
jgi:hypothetical protein